MFLLESWGEISGTTEGKNIMASSFQPFRKLKPRSLSTIINDGSQEDVLDTSDYLTHIRKNIVSNNLSPKRYKQVARIICHIRDEIYTQHPQVIMPTRRMIECLVFNAFDETQSAPSNWPRLVIDTLKNLRDMTNTHLDETYAFTETDGVTRLFPSFELFDEIDVHRFSQILLSHLEKELN